MADNRKMEKKMRNKKGEAFEKFCERSPLSFAQIARDMGVPPQRITHWRNRGVPSKHAIKAAALLGCMPEEISEIAMGNMVAEDYTGYAVKRRETREVVLDIIDSVDDPRALEFIAEQARLARKLFDQDD